MDEPQAYGRKSDVWSLACTLVQMISGKPPYGDLTYYAFVQRSSSTSSNPLTYSGDLLLPTASDATKRLLNSLFLANSKLRPSAQHLLALAQDVQRTIVYGGKIQDDKNENNQVYPLQSANTSSKRIIEKDWQPTDLPVDTYSDAAVSNVSRLINDFQQQIITAHSEHEMSRRDISQNNDDAYKSSRRRAEQKLADTQNNLGDNYYYGRGVPQSDEEALKWYRKAAEQGDANGQYHLGVMYMNGRGVPQSYQEAFKWYIKAAQQEHAGAQCNLGLLYHKGQGVLQSDEQAVKWFGKAAEQGNASGQFNLGIMYRNGRGIPQSVKEACKWYRKAAEQGNASAQYILGVMYKNGQGVPKSDEEAVKWYRKAAEQGHASAQSKLNLIRR